MHVGHDASSMSPGWSLLPSNIIVVLALVNSAVSPAGTLVSQQDPGVPPHSLSVPLPQDCCAFWLVPVCIMVGVSDTEVSMRLLPCAFHIQCVTGLGVPGCAPTDDTQPQPWAKAHLSCNLSHQVWIVGTSRKGNTLLYQRVFPLGPYVCAHAGVARATVHLEGKDRLG